LGLRGVSGRGLGKSLAPDDDDVSGGVRGSLRSFGGTDNQGQCPKKGNCGRSGQEHKSFGMVCWVVYGYRKRNRIGLQNRLNVQRECGRVTKRPKIGGFGGGGMGKGKRKDLGIG